MATNPAQDRDELHYEYQDLDEPSSIRLLRLLPGSPSEVIRCTLLTISLDHTEMISVPDRGLMIYDAAFPELTVGVTSAGKVLGYVALSYTWGGQERTERILCDDRVLLVTPNLLTALKNLRHELASVILWADAVCIDQQSIDDKNTQVALMSRIFSQAMAVVAWLGEGQEQSATAIELIESIGSKVTVGRSSTYADFGKIPNNLKADFRSLGHFYANPYFQRSWIIQEISLAKKIHFRLGNTILSYEKVLVTAGFLEATALVLELLPDVPQEQKPRPGLLTLTGKIQHATEKNEERPLGWLLSSTGGFSASDARDKVIALLGLSSRQTQNLREGDLAPDYRKSTEEIYREATGHILTQESYVRILSCVPDKYFRTSSFKLPSWVPDYTTSPKPAPLGTHNYLHPESVGYTAATDWPCSIKWTPGSDHLTILNAIEVDEIQTISSVGFAGSGQGGDPFDALNAWFRMFAASIRDNFDVVTGADAEACETFWRTITGNKHVGTYPAPPEHAHDFFATYFTFQDGRGVSEISEMYETYQQAIRSFYFDYSLASGGRRFFISKKGRLGMAPWSSNSGDKVFLFGGGPVPFVLRCSNEENSLHSFVGECYVHGIMDGEALRNTANVVASLTLE